HISRRYILNIGRDKARTYMSQKLLDRTLYREAQLLTHIPCFPMKDVSMKSCPHIEFRRCESLVVSKNPLPELLYSRYGASILRVYSLDDSVEFQYSSIHSITTELNREYAGKIPKYYIKD